MNKMLRSILCLVSLACLMVPAAAVAENAEQAYQKAREAYYALQNSARKQMYRDQWERVFERFASVHERFPTSRRGADALYMCGKTFAGLYGISRTRPDAERAAPGAGRSGRVQGRSCLGSGRGAKPRRRTPADLDPLLVEPRLYADRH